MSAIDISKQIIMHDLYAYHCSLFQCVGVHTYMIVKRCTNALTFDKNKTIEAIMIDYL
jgi:hypothetical protein